MFAGSGHRSETLRLPVVAHQIIPPAGLKCSAGSPRGPNHQSEDPRSKDRVKVFPPDARCDPAADPHDPQLYAGGTPTLGVDPADGLTDKGTTAGLVTDLTLEEDPA